MIRSFRNKDLAERFENGKSRKIDARMHKRLAVRLDALDSAASPDEMDRPGYGFHRLQGRPQRYSVHVNGPWCITFEFEGTDAFHVDFEQYH